MEAKLSLAKALRDKISQLKLSKTFCTQKDLDLLDNEKTIKTTFIQNSEIVNSEISMHEEKIAKLKSSINYVSPAEKVQIKMQIKELETSISNARLVRDEILKAEKDPGFCSETEIDNLQKEVDSVQNVFTKIQPLKQGITNVVN